MHTGNLSFVSEHGRPYQLAPAYDMLPMGFSPSTGGALPVELPEAPIHAYIEPEVWARATEVAQRYLDRLRNEPGLSQAFRPCVEALERRIETAIGQIARLG